MSNNKESGKIYICSTPIGNLSDASKRLIDTLFEVDVIFAEDTRVTSKLLNYFEIKTSLKRLDENTMDKRVSSVIDIAKSGKNVAYCSDAGTPGVSDPGLKLVNSAYENNINVEVIPGPTAAITAYVASGFTSQNFYFGSFLPRKSSEIKQVLKDLSNLEAILIFYESPKRLVSSLKIIMDVLPNSEIAICRELTKIHEEVIRGKANQLIGILSSRETIKGEIVICINPCDLKNKDADKDQIINIASQLKDEGLKTSSNAEILSNIFNISKNDAKRIALDVKK